MPTQIVKRGGRNERAGNVFNGLKFENRRIIFQCKIMNMKTNSKDVYKTHIHIEMTS